MLRNLLIAVIVCALIFTAYKLIGGGGGGDSGGQPCEIEGNKVVRIPNLKYSNKYFLCDYYIKTSYNSCCIGDFKHDYVKLCALSHAIAQGCRCLDFEIYSIGGIAQIASSSRESSFEKESKNHIPFSLVMKRVLDEGFNAAKTPMSADPLIINLRIKAVDPAVRKSLHASIAIGLGSIGRYLLQTAESADVSKMKMEDLMGTIIVMVDGTTTGGKEIESDSPLKPLVNIHSGKGLMGVQALRNTELDSQYNEDTFKEANRVSLAIMYPDLQQKSKNQNPALGREYGCQMVAMNFQNYDEHLIGYTNFFNDGGGAFILKENEEKLHPEDVVIQPADTKGRTATQNIGIDGSKQRLLEMERKLNPS